MRPKLDRAMMPVTPSAATPPMRVGKSVDTAAMATAGTLAAQMARSTNFQDARRSCHLQHPPATVGVMNTKRVAGASYNHCGILHM